MTISGSVIVGHASATLVAPNGGNSASPAATPAPSTSTTPQSTSGCLGSSTFPKAPKSSADCIAYKADPAITTATDSTLITKYLNPFIKLLSVLVGLAVTFGIIYGGIEYTMSAGDPQKAQKGRKHILDAVIALISYSLIFAFLNFLIPGGIAV